MTTLDNQAWELQPRLSKEERGNPYLILFQLFEQATLLQLRKKLWNLLKASITGNYRNLPSKEQYDVLSLYEKMEKLLEASHLIYEQQAREQNLKEVTFATHLNKQAVEEKGEGVLVPILQKIVAITNAETIFFISLHKDPATQQHHFSLLIVVQESDNSSQKEYQELIQAACIELALVSVIIVEEIVLNQLLLDGHLFYSVIATFENLLYAMNPEVIQIKDLPVSDIISKAREEFMVSFGRADAFLEGARHYYQQNENELSAFLLHQAVEHCYLSLLTTLINYEERNHNLYELRRFIRVLTEELNEVFIISNEKENYLFSLLQDAYLDARYNNSFKVTDEDIQWLINRVSILINTTQRVFGHYITSFENHFGTESEKNG